MTRRELIDICLGFSNAVECYPFKEDHCIIRHGESGKWFALIITLNNRLCINLKCEPMQADFYRNVYTDCIAGWHMNKTHWNTVRLDGDVPLEELKSMIAHSFELTRPKVKKSSQNKPKI